MTATPNSIVNKILGKGYEKRKVEIEKEGKGVEVEWEKDD